MRRAVLLALCAWVASGRSAAAGVDLPLGIDAPGESETIHSEVPWIEVRGRAGVPGRHDVALVLDFSGSTLEASGYDLDGDGDVSRAWVRAGHRFEGQRPSVVALDGDTILGAELEAARSFLGRLRESDARVALVQFARKTKVVAGLRGPDQVLERLEHMRLSRWPDATNLGDALESALGVLLDGEPWTEGVDRRSVIVVTDGFSQSPANAEEARPLAERLAAVHAAVHILVIASRWEAEDTAPLEEITRRTGGSLRQIDDVRQLPVLIQQAEVSGVRSLRIRNETTGGSARALRLFPNGDFDAFVALTEGENRLRVEADAGPRGHAARERVVRYRPPADDAQETRASRAPTGGSAAADTEAEVLETIRRRTLETRLLAETRRAREARDAAEKRLDVDVGAGPP